MDSNFQYASTEHRISRWVDRIAAGLTKARCASEHGLAMGGGRLAERRFTVGGSGKSVARCHRTVPGRPLSRREARRHAVRPLRNPAGRKRDIAVPQP